MKAFISFYLVFLLLQIGYSINPLREYPRTPKDFNLNYKEIKLDTQDGYTLNAWILKPATENQKNHTFVLVNSDAGNMSYLLPYAAMLLARGYPVVLFDYRGFGHSSDFNMNLDQYYYNEFVTDFETVLQFIKKEQPQQKIGVWAFSMGTLVATLAYKKTPFDVMIGEAFVVDPPTIVERIKLQKNKTLLLPKGAKKVKKKLHRVNTPMLVVCGTKDEVTAVEDGKNITRHNNNRKLLTFEGGHLQGAMVLGFEKYLNKIEEIML